jgi:hypothetical protein
MRGSNRPYKSYRDDYENTGEYRVIEKHLDDEQPAKEESAEEDFLLSDINNNKESTSPVKEQRREPHTPKEQQHVNYTTRYIEEQPQHTHFNKHEPKIEQKHVLKELIEDREPMTSSKRDKFEDITHVQNTSFHIPTRQQDKKEISTSSSGFTIPTQTSKVNKYTTMQSQTKTTNTSTSSVNTGKKKEEPQQPQQQFPQMPYYPYPPYPMYFYPPPGYDPNSQNTGGNNNMPMGTPHPMLYYMPQNYMQQPEKTEPDMSRKQNFGTFGTPVYLI